MRLVQESNACTVCLSLFTLKYALDWFGSQCDLMQETWHADNLTLASILDAGRHKIYPGGGRWY